MYINTEDLDLSAEKWSFENGTIQDEQRGLQFSLMNRLIRLHNERMLLYQQLQREGMVLRASVSDILTNMEADSKKSRQQLGRMLIEHGGEIDAHALRSASKSDGSIGEYDEKTLLWLCESTEVLLVNLYGLVLNAHKTLANELADLVYRQYRSLNNSLQVLRFLQS